MAATLASGNLARCRAASIHANASFLICAVGLISQLLPPTPLSSAITIALFIFLPGGIACRKILASESSVIRRVLITVTVGVVMQYALLALSGFLLPHLGVSRPLSGGLVRWCWVAGLAVIAAHSLWRGSDPVRSIFRGLRIRDALWTAVLAVPPLIALYGVLRLNDSGGPQYAVAASFLSLVLVALAILLPTGSAMPSRIALLCSAFLTAAWQGTFRGGWLLGTDIQHEYGVARLTQQLGVFPLPNAGDPYRGMLSLTVWPVALHTVSGASLRVVFALVPSIFLLMAILTVWTLIRERVSDRTAAFLCTLFLLGSYSMIRQFPGVTRQCYGLFFFAVLIFATMSMRLDVRVARLLVVVAGIGVALSHYSTAYITAFVVIGGWLATLAFRTEPNRRVLTTPITLGVVASAGVWGGAIARTGSNFSQIVSSIHNDGLQLLPGHGNLISRWLAGANIPRDIPASALRAMDVVTRNTNFRWMHVTRHALAVPLVNDPSPVSHTDVGFIGSFLAAVGAVQSEIILVAVVVSIGVCLWLSSRDHQLAPLAGMAVFGLIFAAVSRSSLTLAVQFAPSRVQAQMYLVFVVVVAVTLTSLAPRIRSTQFSGKTRRYRAVAVCVLSFTAIAAVSVAMQFNQVLSNRAVLVAEYSTAGQQIEQAPTQSDITASAWLSRYLPAKQTVQADLWGSYALWNSDLIDATGNRFVSSLDPVILDEGAWVFASHRNITLGRASGGDNAVVASFKFPLAFIASTRPSLYVSQSNVIFGTVAAQPKR